MNNQTSNDNKNMMHPTRQLIENFVKVTERLNKYIRKNKEQEVIIKEIKNKCLELEKELIKNV